VDSIILRTATSLCCSFQFDHRLDARRPWPDDLAAAPAWKRQAAQRAEQREPAETQIAGPNPSVNASTDQYPPKPANMARASAIPNTQPSSRIML
jgi:hypothetical protein